MTVDDPAPAADLVADLVAGDDTVAGADLAALTWRAMRSLVLDSNDKREAVTVALGMSYIRAKALHQLMHGPVSMRGLAKRLATDASYTSIVVEDLAARGLVVRTADPQDRRAKIVTISADGLRAAQTAEEIIGEPPPAFAALDATELSDLLRVLLRLQALSQGPEPGVR
jgi:DNA-binding MarR family transcriptional regulator